MKHIPTFLATAAAFVFSSFTPLAAAPAAEAEGPRKLAVQLGAPFCTPTNPASRIADQVVPEKELPCNNTGNAPRLTAMIGNMMKRIPDDRQGHIIGKGATR